MSDAKDPNQKPEPDPTMAWEPEDVPGDEPEASGDDPLIGTVLRGKWRVLSRIGAGSFGTVYKVRDEKGGWIEALKILSLDRIRGPEGEATRARFLREARIMKRLGAKSRHIVRLSTYEEDLESGLIYFLMEHVEGRNLAQVLQDEGPFSPEKAVSVALQVCDALVAAHESDPPVVHRDLKLQNLMLTEDDGAERIMVLDFGIAKIAQAGPDSRLTKTGAIGTPGYAAPEQLRAEGVDGRTDLFALGVILYALVTGRDPWLGKLAHQPTDQVYRLMAATDRGDVRPLDEAGRAVPPALAHIIMRLLRRDPAERFQSARELRDALLEISEDAPRRAAGGTFPEVPSRFSREGETVRERRLAAVWFADLVGYSTLSATDEGAALELLELFHSTARKVIEEGGGRLVQFIGDEAFAEFTSTDRAVRTAMLFHERFEMATAGVHPRAKLRTGIHVGDVLMGADGDLFGDGVNVAARIQGEAEPGQIVVSQDVWRQLKQRRDFHFRSIGERSLKGLGSPVWLFAVLPEPTMGEEALGQPTTDSPMVAPQARRGRFVHVAGVALAHLTASGAMLFASTILVERYGFPPWVVPVAGVLLAVGLVLVLVTAWVQSRPTWERSVGARSAWSLDLPDIARVLGRGRLPELTWARTVLGGVLAFTALFGVAGVLPLVSGGAGAADPLPMASAEVESRTVAVMPFEVDGAPDLMAYGMADLLARSAEAGGARVEHPMVVSRYLGDAGVVGTERALSAGRALDDSYVAIGTMSQEGSTVTIDAGLLDVRTGEEVRRASVSGPLTSLGSLVAGLTTELLGGTPVVAGEAVELGSWSDSYEALSAYLEGEAELREGDWDEAIAAFARARDEDPDFALALGRLAFARALASAPGPHVRDPDAERALELDGALPPRQRRLVEGLVLIVDGSPEAVEVFRALTGEDPDDPEAWHLLGEALYHVSGPSANGHRDAFETAVSLAEGFGPAQAHLVESALTEGDTARARRLTAELRRRSPESVFLAKLEDEVRVASNAPAPETDGGDGEVASEPSDGSATPEQDPLAGARAAYLRALDSLDDLRSRTVDDGVHPSLADEVEEAGALRRQAEEAASRDDYGTAATLVAEARAAYQSISGDAAVLEQYERRRAALDPLKDGARDPEARAEAEGLEADAEEALAVGDYSRAVSLVERAADVWEAAASEPPPMEEEPADPPPPEAVAEGVLDDLASAIASEDLARVRSVWTSIGREASDGLQELFDVVRDISVDYEVRSLRQEGDGIVVQVHTTYTFVTEQDRQRLTEEIDQLFELGRRDGRWLVVGSR